MFNSKLKLVFIVDIRNWAFDSVAKNLQRQLADSYIISIVYWEDFPSPFAFLEKVNEIDPDCVHFFFREQLSLILSSLDTSSKLLRRFCKRAITTHIPDYLYSDELSLMNRRRLLSFVDSYFATNSDLYEVYKISPFVPDPWGVIYDWIELRPKAKSESLANDKVRIAWSGNSLWGEYVGHVDYKGLRTVITPALISLKEKYNNFEFVCLDSSKGKISNQEVLNEMNRANILIIASEKEGTPLTLIEAMANSCAIVSTEVGIASEVLPKDQMDFIYYRSVDGLYDKLDKLLGNKDLISCLGNKNFEAWKKHFGEDSDLREKWCRFLDSAINRYKIEGHSRKIRMLPDQISFMRAYALSALRWTGALVSQLGMVSVLNKISPKFATTYHRLVHGSHRHHNIDYSIIEGVYIAKINGVKQCDPIVVAAPMWKGVAASTHAVFPENYLRFPFTDHEYPEVRDHIYLERMSELLSQAPSEVIIYSGGSLIHLELARLVKSISPNKRQYFMWHGSPAQWVDNVQLRFFSMWRGEYESNIIDGIICLKRNLEETLNKSGIRAFYLMNPVPKIDDNKRPSELSGKNVNVGLFSSISSWVKNPFPQLLSVSTFDNIFLTTNISKSEVELAVPSLERVRYVHHMDRQDFISVLKKQDINLYVTNTECSPMIALESWACLIPCIVGPAGDVYSTVDEKLGSFLVEKDVDSPSSIAKRIEYVIENYDEIVDLLAINRSLQRDLFNQLKRSVISQL